MKQFGNGSPLEKRDEDRFEKTELRLPDSLRGLDEKTQARFNDLVTSVVPWRGEGYTLGLNAVFTYASSELVAEVAKYVKDTEIDLAGERSRNVLVKKLLQIRDDNRDRINEVFERWQERRERVRKRV